MEIIIQPDAKAASELAARIVAGVIRKKPHAVIGFPTGTTPHELYRILVRLHREEGADYYKYVYEHKPDWQKH